MPLSSLRRQLRLPPAWSILLAVAADAAVSAWRTVSSGGAAQSAHFVHALVWPGIGVLVAVYVFAWLGWALDID